jgi:broad specificity phosphatase PhoE
MDELLLARHGESEAGASGRVGGDPPLTAAGRRQAEALAAQVASFPAEVCLTSGALRAPRQRELGDVRFGSFDGGRLAEYREWVGSHPPSEEAPRGESRAGTLRRFAGAFRVVLSRPESHVFVVAHGLTIRALLDPRPQPVVAGAPYGDSVRLTRAQVESAVERLERWCEDPSW